MPQVIPVVVKILATKIIAGITVAAIVKTAAVYAISQMLTKSARSKASGLGSGTDLTMTREPAPVRRIVYGETRVSGPMAFANISGNKNSTLCVVVLLAAHECEAVGAYLVDDEQTTPGTGGAVTSGTYANKLSMVSHLGDQMTADTMLVSSTGGVWNSSHVLRGITYLAAKLTYDTDVYSGGLPNLSVILRGKKVYDPRTGLTAWSQNPALMVRDYLTNPDYGLGCTADEIDDALIIAAANICDELIARKAGGTEARYRCNGTFTTDAEPAMIIETILSTMAGSIAYSGGKFRVYAGAYSTPSVTLDEGDMAGAIEFQPATGIREACNIVKGSFTSPGDLYQPRDFPRFVDPAHITADGEEITTDLDLAFVSSPAQAQRLAKIYERKARIGGTVSLKCNLSAFRCQTGETIAVSNTRLGWSEKVFSVQEWRFAIGNDGALGVELTCRETDSSIYDWSASEEGILTTTSQFSNPPTTMQNVTGEAANATPGTLGDLNGASTGGGSPGGSIPVQSRGGNWAVAGIPAYDGSAHWYLRQEWSGTITNTMTTPTWPSDSTISVTFSGVATYDPTAHTSSSTLRQEVTRTGEDYWGIDDQLSVLWDANMYTHYSYWSYDYPNHVTATNIDMAAKADQGGGQFGSGSQHSVASDECTPARARDAMLGAAEWAAGKATALSVSTASSPPSGIERRIRYRTEHTAAASSEHWVFGAWVDGVWVPGHSVAVSEATVYPTLTGLAIWTRYRLRIVLQKRPVDAAGSATGDYATGETIYSAPFSTDINGEGGVDWTEIEPEAGYETAIQSAVPELY